MHRIDTIVRKRRPRVMIDRPHEAKQKTTYDGVSRRTFLGAALAGGAAIFVARPDAMFAGAVAKTPRSAANSTWELGGDLKVNRLGFGAMRISGDGIWGWPSDRANALKVLRRAVELGVNLIDNRRRLRTGNKRTAHTRGAVSVSSGPGDCDQGRPRSTRTGPMGARWAP
jgi:hypothetical protein